MPVELRKRPPPKEPAAPPPAAKRTSSTAKKLADKAKAAVSSKTKKNGTAADEAPAPAPAVEAAAVPAVTVTETPAVNGNSAPTSNGAVAKAIGVGQTLELDGFGGTVQTHDGADVTFKDLLDKSGAGIVIFTYPRASTPGCKLSSSCFVSLPKHGLLHS